MKKLLILFSLALVAASCQKDPMREPVTGDGPMVQNTIQLKLDRETAENLQVTRTRSGMIATGNISFDELNERYSVTDMERIFDDNGFPNRTKKSGLDLWYKITFTGNADQVAKDFARVKGVAKANVPLKIRRMDTAPAPRFSAAGLLMNTERPATRAVPADYPFNDPLFNFQWPLYNDGTLISNFSKAGADINVIPAWEKTAGRNDVIVAVIDEGVQYNHPDLEANMWNGNQYGGRNFNAGSDDGDPITWGMGHGTHVAGAVAAVNNNGIGISSAAGGTGAGDGIQIMTCEIFHETDARLNASNANTAKAIKWAADNGAVIAQCSWGYDPNNRMTDDATFEMNDGVTADAINYFIENAGMDDNGTQLPDSPMAGGVMMFSAGNGDPYTGIGLEDPAFPAAYTPCVSVSAIEGNYKASSYSNYGSTVDIAAPGGDYDSYNSAHLRGTFSTLPTNLTNGMVLTEINGNGQSQQVTIKNVQEPGYGWMPGTSMSCPIVSGVAALIVSQFGGAGFTADQLKSILLDPASSRDIDSYQSSKYRGKIGRLIDAGLALNNNAGPDPEAPTVTPESGQSNTFTMSVTETKTLKFTLTNATAWELDDPTNNIGKSDSSNNNAVTLTFTGSKYTPGAYEATLMVSNDQGTTEVVISYSITDNGDVVATFTPNPFTDHMMVRTNKSGNGTLRLYTVSGAEVFKKTISFTSGTETRVDGLNKLSSGVYLVKLDVGGKKATAKVIKK